MKHLLTALVIAAAPSGALAETLTGPAEVIDGDTLAIGERKVRLFGIDAPEGRQTCSRGGETWACGEESARQLAELVSTGPVVCTGDEDDRYGRLVAVCHAGRFELNRAMVEHGWATAFRTYSNVYVADETRARMARRGIWGSTFDLPQAYRTGQRLQQPERQERTPAASSEPREQHQAGGCTIKGNRNRRGQWIYHLPGMPYYEATRAEEMFCSEAEARAAGYRRALVR